MFQQQALAAQRLQTASAASRTHDPARYAVYYAPPPASPWWTFGCAWLGRDPVTGRDLAPPSATQWDAADWTRITAEPRRYGFHATLKAPFRLAPGHTPAALHRQAARLASSLTVVTLPPLRLLELDDFVALGFAPDAPGSGEVAAVAAQCVSGFDHLRAPPAAAELARRHQAPLTPRQAHLLAQWGYPYVFEEFRFHLTLSARLPAGERAQLIESLKPRVAALASEPLLLDALAIYRQSEPDAPFVVARRYGFDGSVEVYAGDSAP